MSYCKLIKDMCTSIALTAQNGDVVHGRTMEWGTFDLKTRLVIIPRGFEFVSTLSGGENGKKWQAKYGAVGLDALNQDYLMDGINEKGISASTLFHPGTAEYQDYKKEDAKNSLAPIDVLTFILTMAGSIEDVRDIVSDVRVVPVVEKAFGDGPAPGHFAVYDTKGKAIVIEYLEGELKIFDAPLRVMTNSPSYDWHETNIRNYTGLSTQPHPTLEIAGKKFTPPGAGSGMIGLPGDFTPVSRFVRAVAWTHTARKMKDGDDAIYEVFRILDNFNVPLGAGENSGGESIAEKDGLRSDTIWTVAYDKTNMSIYYHTHNNRRLRKVDLKKIDFENEKLTRRILDVKKKQDVQEVPMSDFE